MVQSRIDPQDMLAYRPIMEAIAATLFTTVGKFNQVSFDRKVRYLAYRVRTSALGSALLVRYFSQFPLFSSKHLDCAD